MRRDSLATHSLAPQRPSRGQAETAVWPDLVRLRVYHFLVRLMSRVCRRLTRQRLVVSARWRHQVCLRARAHTREGVAGKRGEDDIDERCVYGYVVMGVARLDATVTKVKLIFACEMLPVDAAARVC